MKKTTRKVHNLENTQYVGEIAVNKELIFSEGEKLEQTPCGFLQGHLSPPTWLELGDCGRSNIPLETDAVCEVEKVLFFFHLVKQMPHRVLRNPLTGGSQLQKTSDLKHQALLLEHSPWQGSHQVTERGRGRG